MNHQHQQMRSSAVSAGEFQDSNVVAAHAHHGHGAADAVKKGPAKPAVDIAHKCSVCASCCSAVALTSKSFSIALPPISQANVSESLSEPKSPPALVPDKPPRA